nr:Bax inhibitor-1/YccA family protein [Desulfobulbaceae bacterium]
MYNQHSGPPPVTTINQATAQASTVFLAKVFNWMAVGLLLTAVSAYVVASSPALQQIIYPIHIVLALAELGLVFFLSARIQKISAQTATALFVAFSVLNGMTLSAILLIYTMTSIASTFIVTAGMFGSMAIYGMVTKKDLTGMGSFLMMGLFGIIIASVVNIFMASSMMAWVISGLGVIIFTGLTAYDVQKITQIGASGIMEQGDVAIQKMAIMGALTLYLDFINLFLMLLHFLGNRRD